MTTQPNSELFTCTKCNDPKPRDAFGTTAGCRVKRCKKCLAAAARYSWETSLEFREKHKDQQQRRIVENQRFLYNYLKENGCVDCAERNPLCLQFDHVIGEKRDCVTSLTVCSLEVLKTEISKCVIRCANCHAKKTVQERNSIRYKLYLEDIRGITL
jgi:hypothetical protein